MKTKLLFLLVVLACACKQTPKKVTNKKVQIDTLQGQSLLGEPLVSEQVRFQDDNKVKNYKRVLAEYQNDSLDLEKLIWVGRRMAYLGDYKKAIKIYSNGFEDFSNDARLYRHRGHRYISIRQLDRAIADLNKAAKLIEGTEDTVEPDGIPNKLNQPVSSLHTNIYYHLGLAYYLKGNWEKAHEHFQNCYDASTNDDMRVAASHWLYMILRRTNNTKEAEALLESITPNMNIIENDGYHQLLLFYKSELDEGALRGNDSSGSSEAVRYGIANWHHYNGNFEKAKELYEALISNGNWPSFGYIAAEAELARWNRR